MSLLSVENLAGGYGDVQVLWGVDLAVEQGQIVSLIGSNGAGKSTLLRTISGLLVPTGGRVTFADADMSGREPGPDRRGRNHPRAGRAPAVRRDERPR